MSAEPTETHTVPPQLTKRRSGSETRKRGKSILIRLDDAERVEVEEASRKAGMTVGTYARHQMLKAPPARSVRRPSLERELAAQLLGQVGRVGGNLHQLVRHLNFGREADRRQLGDVLEALELLKREIMQALGRKETARQAKARAENEAAPESPLWGDPGRDQGHRAA